jgi:hypothetical protein
MAEASIRHGQEVRADLPGIRVTADRAGWRTAPEPSLGTVYFCTMGSIRVHQVLAAGDGQPLPSEVVLEGLVMPEPGTYDIVNALVRSNGALRITADADTRIVQRASSLASGWV